MRTSVSGYSLRRRDRLGAAGGTRAVSAAPKKCTSQVPSSTTAWMLSASSASLKRREQRALAPRGGGAQDVADRLLLREGSLSGLGRVPGVAKNDHGSGKRAQTSDQLGSGGAIGGGRDLRAEWVGEQAELQQQRGCPAADGAIRRSRRSSESSRRSAPRAARSPRTPASTRSRSRRRAGETPTLSRSVRPLRSRSTRAANRSAGSALVSPSCCHPAAEDQDHEWPLLVQRCRRPRTPATTGEPPAVPASSLKT